MIYQIYGTDAHIMTKELMEAAHVAGMIPSGVKVALKPNLVLAQRPESGATTHAGVLSGCIEYLQDHGVQSISIIEGSWVGDNTERAVQICGYDKVSSKYGVPFFDLKQDKTRKVDTPLRKMEICCRALDAGYLIDLPVLKGHCQTKMTCALKNLKGCIPDREKRRFHSEGLHRPIAALAAVLKPDLVIVDSICGDLDFEEGGNPIQTNRMYLGTDPVQIDTYGCRLMGIPISAVPYIQMSERWGAGSTVLTDNDICCINEPYASISAISPTGAAARLAHYVQQNSACSACYANLIRALYELERSGTFLNQDIAIGQGWRKRRFDGLGIGNCCTGAKVCVPGCPPMTENIIQVLKQLK